MKKTFLVTGGCGFIGSHLSQALFELGHSVIIIDDFSSGDVDNISEFVKDVKLYACKVEEFNFESLDKIDCIFHLAAQASVPYSIDNLFESSSTNLLSTLKVIAFGLKEDVPVVYASSSALYGNLSTGIENSDVDLLSPYAVDKLVAEIYFDMAHKVYGLKSYGLRFFNVYGPRQDPLNPYSGVISIFIAKLLNDQSITINGGHQTRDFIYVKDVVIGIIKAYEYLIKHPVATYSNLLTGASLSINDLVSLLSDILSVSPVCTYRDLPPGDPVVSLGSVEKMMKQLIMPSPITLSDGLFKTIESLKVSNEES